MSTVLPFASGAALGLALVLLALAATPAGTPHSAPPRSRSSWSHRLRASRTGRLLPAAAVVAGIVGVCTGWPVAAVAAAAAVLGLPPVLAPAGPRRALALAQALTAWSRRLADLLTAGSGGLEQALLRSAATTPQPLTGPVQRLAERVRTEGAQPALRRFADELADPAADEVVLALLLRLQHGGRGVAEALHAHADALSAEATSRREIEADRATARTTVRSLIAITLALFTGLVLCARDYLTPLDTAAGQGVLALAALIAAAALWWMHRLTTSTPLARYLTGSSTQDGGAS